jgi:predicted nuclease of predicted toxin-antitoxin system
MDVHVHQAITGGLRLRGVDVLTAQEDGARQLSDSDLLDRATALGRVLFSQDEDLLREATRRQRSGETFAGVIYAHQLKVSIGQCIRDLEFLALAGEPKDFVNEVVYLPLH